MLIFREKELENIVKILFCFIYLPTWPPSAVKIKLRKTEKPNMRNLADLTRFLGYVFDYTDVL